jgi:hypothetical protein
MNSRRARRSSAARHANGRRSSCPAQPLAVVGLVIALAAWLFPDPLELSAHDPVTQSPQAIQQQPTSSWPPDLERTSAPAAASVRPTTKVLPARPPLTVAASHPSPTTTLSPKAAACVRLTEALRDEASRVQALHDEVRVDETVGQVTSTYSGDIPKLYDAAYASASFVADRIVEYRNLGGALPEEYDFERRTDLMLSTDLPALRRGLNENPDSDASPAEAWNELTRYTDYARQISRTNCGR